MNTVKCNGMSAKELDFKVDYLTMQLEQIENKLVRKNEELIDSHLSVCRTKLAKTGRNLQQVNHLMIKAARGTDIFYSRQLEAAMFCENHVQSSVEKQSWHHHPSGALG
ncbi:hypothetical protein [Sporolactobacillus laevolacticus]|uniref:hypothetical protein n=1 Tax=Sporolactobacillus laevolacticus TaxID=33018 RepID=UPI0025B42035|nr:hypothetical protein [Sporolactobacillus laevolacticus]MDN3953751.1 hypothetical protein [Sporolactobacillus laevolacticus]